jgi:hypothetical protein
MTIVRMTGFAVVASLAASAAWAHHSFSAFNRSEAAKKTIAGTVKEYGLVNPHGWMKITAPDAGGKTANWAFEMASATQLTKQGWAANTVKHGDRIEITFFPLRFGSYGGQIISVKLRNGKVLNGLAEVDRGYPKQ